MADMTLGKGVDDMVGPDVQVSERIQQAMDMAKAFHEGQMRRGNGGMKPYYDEHILGVYNILREECGITDEDILITALLHDTVEDTECTLDDIESAFGSDIREQVRLLTRIQGGTVFRICQEVIFPGFVPDGDREACGQASQSQNDSLHA